MIPTSMFLAVLLVSILLASVGNFFIGRYVERRKIEGRPNVFDAYTDAELDTKRRYEATKVRQYHGSRMYQRHFTIHVRNLSIIDREITRRNREKDRQRILEESDMTQTMRELSKFDSVFSSLELNQKDKK